MGREQNRIVCRLLRSQWKNRGVTFVIVAFYPSSRRQPVCCALSRARRFAWVCGQGGGSARGGCAASLAAGAGQMQGGSGMRPCTWRGRGQGAAWLGQAEVAFFVWPGLSMLLPLVLQGLGSIFSICSCFPPASPCSKAGTSDRLREQEEGGAAVGGVSRQLELRKDLGLWPVYFWEDKTCFHLASEN